MNSPINDSYCVNVPVYAGLLAGSKETVNVCQSPETLSVNLPVVTVAHIVKGQSQKKDISPIVVNCYQRLNM